MLFDEFNNVQRYDIYKVWENKYNDTMLLIERLEKSIHYNDIIKPRMDKYIELKNNYDNWEQYDSNKKIIDARSKAAATMQASDLKTDSNDSAQNDDEDEDNQRDQGHYSEGTTAASAIGFSFDSSSENLLSAAMAQSGTDQDESNDGISTKMRRQDLEGPPGKLNPLVVNDRRAELRALELNTSVSVKHAIGPDDDDDDPPPTCPTT